MEKAEHRTSSDTLGSSRRPCCKCLCQVSSEWHSLCLEKSCETFWSAPYRPLIWEGAMDLLVWGQAVRSWWCSFTRA